VESEAKYTAVGIFVVLSTLAAALAFVWLAKWGGRAENDYYTVYFERQSLEGLQKDSWVTMRGIRVGSVEEFRISPTNIEQVKVRLRVDDNTPVKTDTKAIMKRNLLTGLAWIDLAESSQHALLLQKVPRGEEFPVIPEGMSELEAVAKSIPELASQGAEALRRLNQVLADENVLAVKNSLANTEKFTEMLTAQDSEFSRMVHNIAETAQELQEVSRTVNAAVKRGDREIAGLAEGVQTSIDEMNKLLALLSEEAAGLSASLKGSSQVMVQDVGNIAQSLAQAARAFTTTAEQLADLKNVVGGPNVKSLGPGESLPQ
jgi:phospholipid/cholesterol/gamma-HCH transport system substrate-binding protein